MTAVLAGAACALGAVLGWHLAARRWLSVRAACPAWLALAWWRKALLTAAWAGSGALAGLAWALAPGAAVTAVAAVAGSTAVSRAVRAAAARREG